MVLESIISVRNAEKEPWELFFLGLLYASVGVIIALVLFEGDASMVMVLLTVLACTALMHATLRYEFKKDITEHHEGKLLREHAKAITFLMFLFVGFVVAFTLWFTLLPEQASNQLFASQLGTIQSINGAATSVGDIFFIILFNNLRVMIFSLLFSFFFGLGAIFVLVWNASVIGAAAGNFTRSVLAGFFEQTGQLTLAHYFAAASIGLSRYLVHGVPEMAAYFVAGLAGGIISIGVMNKMLTPTVYKDAAALTGVAIALLVFAALIEVAVTPLLF